VCREALFCICHPLYNARFELSRETYISDVYVSWTFLCLIFEIEKSTKFQGLSFQRNILYIKYYFLRHSIWEKQDETDRHVYRCVCVWCTEKSALQFEEYFLLFLVVNSNIPKYLDWNTCNVCDPQNTFRYHGYSENIWRLRTIHCRHGLNAFLIEENG
jgi:hypothetical protein